MRAGVGRPSNHLVQHGSASACDVALTEPSAQAGEARWRTKVPRPLSRMRRQSLVLIYPRLSGLQESAPLVDLDT